MSSRYSAPAYCVDSRSLSCHMHPGYQFKIIANDAYIGNTEGLVDFFCRFNGYMGLAAFIFQLALTPLLLSKLGIRVTLFVAPAVLMGSSLGVLAAPTLLMAGILQGSHHILRFSLDKSSTELLYVPVSPRVRSQVKSFIDSFISRSADGIAGLILLLFAERTEFRSQRGESGESGRSRRLGLDRKRGAPRVFERSTPGNRSPGPRPRWRTAAQILDATTTVDSGTSPGIKGRGAATVWHEPV